MNEIDIKLIESKDYRPLFNIIEKNRQRLLTYFPRTADTITDIEAARKFTQLKLKQALKKEQFYFIVIFKKSSEMIGGVILKNIDWTVPKGELAYFIDFEYEHNGYTSYAVSLLKEYAFNQLKMEKLYIKLNPQNIGSKKVALKNGFKKEGYLKSEFRTGHGVLMDMERYGLVK